MKKIFKDLSMTLLVFLLLIIFLFWIGYLFKINRDLVDYNISEKLVLKFEDDNNNYLVNLNNWKYILYKWDYKKYSYNYEWWFDIISDRKIYNKNNTYYFDYWLRIYNEENKKIYSYPNSVVFESYWSKDWKYVISRNWAITRMFWLFFQVTTAHPIIMIIEPQTWKMTQLPILNNEWWYKRVEKILWYMD